ncbi:MAG: restriction endonuclease subunit S [Chloroflexi bacterium]|nr:restriction endonuclease subunit S [Chloroflexota bacterium]
MALTSPFLKSSWRKVNFGDVVRNVNETVQDAQTCGLERFVGLEHMDPESLHIQRWGLIADGTSFTRRFRKGQVLFGKRRAYQRKVAAAEFDGLCSSDILVFEPKGEQLLPDLLPFICQTEGFFEHALDTSAGSLSPRTKFKELSRYEFPLPALEEQRRIAEILWAADDLTNRYLKVLEALISLRYSYEDSIFFDDANENFQVHLSDIVQINPSIKPKLNDTDIVSFITMADVTEDGEIINFQERSFGEVKKGYTVFQEGDVLFAKITPCMENGKGAVALNLINGVGCGSTEFHILRPKNPKDQMFIYFLSMNKKFRQTARRFMRGTAGQLRVPKDFLEDYFIHSLPTLEKREEIGEKLTDINRGIQAQKKCIERAKEVKNELLRKFLRE